MIASLFRNAAEAVRKTFRPTFVERLTPYETRIFEAFSFHHQNGAEWFCLFKDYTNPDIAIMGLTPQDGEDDKTCIRRNLSDCRTYREAVMLQRIDRRVPAETAFERIWWRPGTVNDIQDFSRWKFCKVYFDEFTPRWAKISNPSTRAQLALAASRRNEPTIR